MTVLDPETLVELREDFDYNDANGDGRIDFEEFCRLLTDLEADMSREECQLGFQAIDTDNDGVVSFEEFIDWWTAD